MKRAFKYLRITTAAILMLIVLSIFLSNLRVQMDSLLDGPLAHYISYTFAYNKITLASFLAIVLVFDFKVVLPRWGRRCLRILGVVSVILSLLGFFYLTQQMIFSNQFRDNSFGLIYAEFYLFQLAYLLVSCVALSKSFEPNLTADDFTDKSQ